MRLCVVKWGGWSRGPAPCAVTIDYQWESQPDYHSLYAQPPLFGFSETWETTRSEGLIPSNTRGTMTEDIAGYIRRMQGSVEWNGDMDGTTRTAIAKSRKQVYP